MNARILVIKVMVVVFLAMTFLMAALSAMRDTVRNSRDVERKLDARLLATVHRERKSSSLLSRFKKNKRSILISSPATSFRFTETLRKLASRTTNLMNERHARSLLVTSIMENEGKSTIASNLALAMAEEGNRVLLIDADFRKPALYKVLNMKETVFTGLSDYLLQEGSTEQVRKLIRTVPGTSLDCILNKTAMPQTMEMLSSSRMRDLIRLLQEEYDYVLVDSSPMQLVADAEEIADMVDACMLVVRQHFVEARQINDGIDALGSRVLGCVFNYARSGRFGSVGSFAYGNGSYGYGYGYGGHYDR
jgi:capsular exopolysaccharide synthesis family protein